MFLLEGVILWTGRANHIGYGPAVAGCEVACSGSPSTLMFPRISSNFRQEIQLPYAL